MRRIVAFALLSAFLLQTTGAAAATSTSANLPPITIDLLATLASVKASLATTMIGALASGQMSRYQAIHDTPPDFSRVRHNRSVDLSVMRNANVARLRLASGVRIDAPNGMAQMRPPALRPFASAQSGAASAATSLRVFRPSVAPRAAVRRLKADVDNAVSCGCNTVIRK